MQKRRHLLGLLGLVAASSQLASCGFRLRGSGVAASFPFQRIYVNQASNSQLGADLRRQLSPYEGLSVVENRQDAQVALDILSLDRNKTILTRDSRGRVREYTLTLVVRYRVNDGQGRELLPPSQVSAGRTLSYNESAALGKEAEENMLYRDMQIDAIQQILRRLTLLPMDGEA